MNDQRNGGIAWTDFTANPIKYRDANGRDVWACVKVSAGCANCYSATTAKRFDRGTDYNAAEMANLTPYLDEKEVNTLLKSTKISGKRVFIGDMTDIFGEWVQDEMLDQLFAVFALRPDVTFQVLTKRPERMLEYITVASESDDVTAAKFDITGEDWDFFASPRVAMPLQNVWLGVSVENQETADQRISQLLDTPAAVRFVSYEPALGPVDFVRGGWSWLEPLFPPHGNRRGWDRGLDWIIVGGESGPGARPCDVAWIRSTVRQCKAAGVPVFVKQLGSNPASMDSARWMHHSMNGHEERLFVEGRHVASVFDQKGGGITWWTWDEGCGGENDVVADTATAKREAASAVVRQGFHLLTLKARKGGDPSEWPEDLRVREFPAVSR